MTYPMNETVAAIGNINFEGNVIPMEWYHHIRFESGKPDTNALLLLSDIVYWYRPTTIRDEATGRIIGYGKKFKADLLQRSYQDYENLFGFSKKQIRDCFIRLEAVGVIKRVLRTIDTLSGLLNNVLFIALIPEKLAEITSKLPPINIEVNRSLYQSYHLITSRESPHNFDVKTYTKTTTQITTETSSSRACANEDEEDETSSNNPQEIIRIWNEIAQKEAHPAILTEQRSISLQTCLKHHFQNSLEQFKAYCQKISQTPFLMGQGANGWKATLDWALDPAHITKVLEGHYFHPKPSAELPQGQQSYSQTIPITAEELNRYGSTWAKVCEKLISELGANTFTSWFRDLVPEQIESANPVLKSPTAFVRDRIKSHHRQAIEQAIQSFNPQFQSLTFSLFDQTEGEER